MFNVIGVDEVTLASICQFFRDAETELRYYSQCF
jgi:hypothetical protein